MSDIDIDTPAGEIKYLTKHIKDFTTLDKINSEQYLLGIDDIDKGNGSKISYENVLTSSISTDANNAISVSSVDKKLYVKDTKVGDIADLKTTDKTSIVNAVNELEERIDEGGSLPSQEGHDGEFLTTDGTSASWSAIQQSGYHPDILTFQWSDHLINDMQWLRADTFSWQSGDVYVTAYNKLVEEYATGTEETEGSITFKRTTNGFKIALASQESAILSKYNTDGIAWYYILDTTNKQFKLPRTKFGFEGLRGNVGDDIAESLPNITGNLIVSNGGSASSYTGAFYTNSETITGEGGGSGNDWKGYFDASRSSSTYQDNAPVQERATQMYLYFYVGEYSQTAIEQTAGITTEQLNNKIDVDHSNDTKPYLMTTYVNGTSGYNIWSNGYCEQWGYDTATTASHTITLIKSFNDINYNIQRTLDTTSSTSSTYRAVGVYTTKTVNSFNLYSEYNSYWQASGYIE